MVARRKQKPTFEYFVGISSKGVLTLEFLCFIEKEVHIAAAAPVAAFADDDEEEHALTVCIKRV